MAVSHAVEGRRGVERDFGGEPVTQRVQQPQRKRLVGHSRPVVEQFVASAPDRQRGVSAQPPDDRYGLSFQYGEVLRVVGIAVARQRKFLPDHYSPAVAALEEGILIDDAAAPRTQHVEMGLRGNSDQRFVTGRIDRAGEQFGADPVGALGEDAAAVQLDLRGGGAPGFGKAGGFAPGPFVHHQTDAAETDPLLHAFQIAPCGVAECVARGV